MFWTGAATGAGAGAGAEELPPINEPIYREKVEVKSFMIQTK